MRKYLKIAAGKDHIIQTLTDTDTWLQWWPDLKSVKVLEQRSDGFVVDLSINMKIGGKMTLDVDYSQPDTIAYRQIKGWFKTYTNNWHLMPDQQGTGTRVKIAVEVDAGPLVSKRMLYEKVSQSLDQVEENLNGILQELAPPQATPPAASSPGPAQEGQIPIHVFPTAKGLEMWISGRRYLMQYAGWSKAPANLPTDR